MDSTNQYETLDPENWDELRALAHRMVDDMLTYLETTREHPVWQPIPDDVWDAYLELVRAGFDKYLLKSR